MNMITKAGKINGGNRPRAGRPKWSANQDRAEQVQIAHELLEEGLTVRAPWGSPAIWTASYKTAFVLAHKIREAFG